MRKRNVTKNNQYTVKQLFIFVFPNQISSKPGEAEATDDDSEALECTKTSNRVEFQVMVTIQLFKEVQVFFSLTNVNYDYY